MSPRRSTACRQLVVLTSVFELPDTLHLSSCPSLHFFYQFYIFDENLLANNTHFLKTDLAINQPDDTGIGARIFGCQHAIYWHQT